MCDVARALPLRVMLRLAAREPVHRPTRIHPHRSRPLKIPGEQLIAIQAWIAEGADRAAEELAEDYSADTEIDVLETRCCALADFGTANLPASADDVVAGSLVSFHGGIQGAALLAMEPVDALGWARTNDADAEPVASYLAQSNQILTAVVESAARALGVDTHVGRPVLEEAPIAGCLLRTHAPSDTMIVCSRVEITAGRQRFASSLFVLLEAKVVNAILGALSMSVH
jgi:hypothetical protein